MTGSGNGFGGCTLMKTMLALRPNKLPHYGFRNGLQVSVALVNRFKTEEWKNG